MRSSSMPYRFGAWASPPITFSISFESSRLSSIMMVARDSYSSGVSASTMAAAQTLATAQRMMISRRRQIMRQ